MPSPFAAGDLGTFSSFEVAFNAFGQANRQLGRHDFSLRSDQLHRSRCVLPGVDVVTQQVDPSVVLGAVLSPGQNDLRAVQLLANPDSHTTAPVLVATVTALDPNATNAFATLYSPIVRARRIGAVTMGVLGDHRYVVQVVAGADGSARSVVTVVSSAVPANEAVPLANRLQRATATTQLRSC